MNNFFYKLVKFFAYFVFAVVLALVCLLAAFKVKFPIEYSPEINAASSEFGVDSNLVRAIINQESGFSARAKSNDGAIGLMQIMPQTAIWIADELEILNFDENFLYDPELNVRFGCFYVSYLTKKFGDLDMVLFAYNAGEGNLIKVLEANEVLETEKIEIAETRNYITKVKKYKKVYDRII